MCDSALWMAPEAPVEPVVVEVPVVPVGPVREAVDGSSGSVRLAEVESWVERAPILSSTFSATDSWPVVVRSPADEVVGVWVVLWAPVVCAPVEWPLLSACLSCEKTCLICEPREQERERVSEERKWGEGPRGRGSEAHLVHG